MHSSHYPWLAILTFNMKLDVTGRSPNTFNARIELRDSEHAHNSVANLVKFTKIVKAGVASENAATVKNYHARSTYPHWTGKFGPPNSIYWRSQLLLQFAIKR